METVITEKEIKPFLLDLESTNMTFINGQEIESARYYQILDKDVLTFGTCPL